MILDAHLKHFYATSYRVLKSAKAGSRQTGKFLQKALGDCHVNNWRLTTAPLLANSSDERAAMVSSVYGRRVSDRATVRSRAIAMATNGGDRFA
jgi:hypothetical protein